MALSNVISFVIVLSLNSFWVVASSPTGDIPRSISSQAQEKHVQTTGNPNLQVPNDESVAMRGRYHGYHSLHNAGQECWTTAGCGDGACYFCGTGFCCRKNWPWNGCNGIDGGDIMHVCVKNPSGKRGY